MTSLLLLLLMETLPYTPRPFCAKRHEMTKVKAQPGVNFIVFVIIYIPTRQVNQSLPFFNIIFLRKVSIPLLYVT